MIKYLDLSSQIRYRISNNNGLQGTQNGKKIRPEDEKSIIEIPLHLEEAV